MTPPIRDHFMPITLSSNPYNQPQKNTTPITIISEHHGWRKLSGVQTNDYFACRNAMQNGCHLQRASFDLRHPEEMICDLSNLDSIYNGMSSADIITIWKYLNTSTRKIKGCDIARIEGNDLSPEIAIAGPSKAILRELKESFVREAFLQSNIDLKTSDTPTFNRGLAKNRLLINSNAQTINFHNAFCAFYSTHVAYEHWDECTALNTRYIYEDHNVWNQIAKISKNKLFLLSAGLPLALGYMAATGDPSVHFSEIHQQNDASILDKDKAFKGIFPVPALEYEPWLIIDKSYTGGTLKKAANEIRKQYGYTIEVKTLALFPKSFSAFMSADYAVYAGKLFNVRACASQLERERWHLQLLED